jgi:RND family efflux transporter MFP subunit
VDLEVKRAQSAAVAAAQLLSSDFSDSQRELYESGVIGQIDYEKVRVQSESARATQRDARSVLELAKKKRAEHELRAPWTGRVTGLSLANGQLLTPDVTIGYLASVDGSAQTFRLETKLHATWFGRVTAGTKALVTQIAGNRIEPAILAEVTEVGAVVQPESQTFRVALTLGLTEGRGTEAALAQGMLARGQLQLTTGDKAMVVPASAIVEWDSDNNGTVFVIGADDRLRVRRLRLGRYSQDNVLVLQGLEVGERLVERWSPGLYEGLPVQPLASVRSKSP